MQVNNKLMNFLDKSSSNFQAVAMMKEELLSSGFKQLDLNEIWHLAKGEKYFLTVNDSAIIAFDLVDFKVENGFKIVASHTDAPNFKIKPKAINIKDGYVSVNTEAYGGLINYAWFDRPLKLAGRVIVEDDKEIKTKLFDSNKAIGIIPSLAIHMNREVNKEAKFNRQTDMSPIIGQGEDFDFKQYLAKNLSVKAKDIIDYDLYFKPNEKASLFGVNDEFIGSNHLDNLQCAYLSFLAFKESKSNRATNVYVSFDNEEVGSMTKQGAQATILKDVLERISEVMKASKQQHQIALAKSFIVSADNAHANHPNFAKFNDKNHMVKLNEGVVIKYSANQKYTTDALSSSLIQKLAKEDNIKIQKFANRSDSPGGSTLGAISGSQVSIKSVDIGLPQLAMHSANEMAGSQDTESMYKLLKNFYNKSIKIKASSIEIE